jgi:hypothetical protein
MDALKALVIGMGVLIVAMMGLLAWGLARHVAPHETLAAQVVLEEPAGTHIGGISPVGGNLAIWLQGGGEADRVVLLAPNGQVTGRVSLRQH